MIDLAEEREERRRKVFFSRGGVIYKLLAFDLYQLCLLRQLGLKKISYKLAVFYH